MLFVMLYKTIDNYLMLFYDLPDPSSIIAAASSPFIRPVRPVANLTQKNVYCMIVCGSESFFIYDAWLSLVERCVRDAEVASSNLVASTDRKSVIYKGLRFFILKFPLYQTVTVLTFVLTFLFIPQFIPIS